MFKTGSIFLQGSLRPARTILTQNNLVSSFTLRSTSKTLSSVGYNLRRYQSHLADNKIETKSIETKSIETKPIEAKPAEAKPAEAKPAEAKPVETKPVETKQDETKPVEVSGSKLNTAEPKSINESDNRITKDGKYKPPINTSFEGTFKGDYQRIIKYTLIPLSAIPFYTSYAGIALHPMIDTTIAVSFLWYAHYGFSSLIIDKIPKDKYSKGHRATMWTLYTSTFLGMCGIYELETENNGVVDLITRIWNDDESNIYIFGK
ncbi:mitochondrial import inner membrane translocase subunit Tim18p [Monosporozyma servazzii]